jgi:NAD(P)-dependent dehydrogenase (short-subunit alcohol dehydrogenase family)
MTASAASRPHEKECACFRVIEPLLGWVLDLQGTGIRVNVLSPGATVTPALEALATGEARDGCSTL